MRTRFYAPCSGSCVADRIVGDDEIPGRVSHNASGLHALFRTGKEKRHAMLPRGVCMLASRIACRQVVLPDPFILFVGRLDWIRTNDPHHVKVVL